MLTGLSFPSISPQSHLSQGTSNLTNKNKFSFSRPRTLVFSNHELSFYLVSNKNAKRGTLRRAAEGTSGVLVPRVPAPPPTCASPPTRRDCRPRRQAAPIRGHVSRPWSPTDRLSVSQNGEKRALLPRSCPSWALGPARPRSARFLGTEKQWHLWTAMAGPGARTERGGRERPGRKY